jgi:hypothetical protein
MIISKQASKQRDLLFLFLSFCDEETDGRVDARYHLLFFSSFCWELGQAGLNGSTELELGMSGVRWRG